MGLPGSGLSYTQEQRLDGARGADAAPTPSSGGARALIWLVVVVLVVVVVAIATLR